MEVPNAAILSPLPFQIWSGGIVAYRLSRSNTDTQLAEKLKWNRSINSRGGTAHNIPLDLAVEHLNNSTKRDLKNLGANLTPAAAQRCNQAADYVDRILDAYDSTAAVTTDHGWHAKPLTDKDFNCVLKHLLKAHVMQFHLDRQHKTFPDFSHILEGLQIEKLYKWIETDCFRWR